jgi:hypothetical protein
MTTPEFKAWPKVLLENDERAKGNLEQFKAQNFEVVS